MLPACWRKSCRATLLAPCMLPTSVWTPQRAAKAPVPDAAVRPDAAKKRRAGQLPHGRAGTARRLLAPSRHGASGAPPSAAAPGGRTTTTWIRPERPGLRPGAEILIRAATTRSDRAVADSSQAARTGSGRRRREGPGQQRATRIEDAQKAAARKS